MPVPFKLSCLPMHPLLAGGRNWKCFYISSSQANKYSMFTAYLQSAEKPFWYASFLKLPVNRNIWLCLEKCFWMLSLILSQLFSLRLQQEAIVLEHFFFNIVLFSVCSSPPIVHHVRWGYSIVHRVGCK